MRGLALVPLLLFVSCGDDPPNVGSPDKEVCLARRSGQGQYCIDVYEASRSDATSSSAGSDETAGPRSLDGRLPWTMVTWDGAKKACQAKNKRLCERDEWLDACDGGVGEDQGTKYTYGNELMSAICNTDGSGVAATGSRSMCKASTGTYDQSGNVREWTGNIKASAATRGGSWMSSVTHECKSGDGMQLLAPDATSPEVGFRCCRDG
ncbi:MAG: SUMF1/EgtB/PvdO family nonheme iron enzyme [Myxococcota bacterium]